MIEDDIEKLRIEKAVLIAAQDNKQDEQVDTQVTINYTNYFMEHLEDLLIGGSNPHKNASLFGLLFDEKPTYQELVDGTPKLACLFKLNEEYKKTKTFDVNKHQKIVNRHYKRVERLQRTLDYELPAQYLLSFFINGSNDTSPLCCFGVLLR